MKEYLFPLATETWGDEEYSAIEQVVMSRRFTMGPKVAQFETDFAKYFRAKYAVMVNSGSSANLLMVAALRYTKNNPINEGDEVIVPAVSWSTSFYPLYQYGLKIKFVDIDIKTLNYDLEALEAAITQKTKLILCVNLLGNPNNFSKINKIISGKNIRLIEDNCESMGAIYDEKYTGTFGDIGTFSTFFSHHISTMEGGVLLTDDEEIYHILLALRAHGWTRNLPKINQVTGSKSEDDFYESFNFVLPGYNVRPLEMSGAIGIHQLKKLKNFVNERRKNAKIFTNTFKNNNFFTIQTEIGESSWFGFSIIMKKESPLTRGEFINLLNKSGFETRPIVSGNFTKNSVCNYFDYCVFGDLPNAEYLDKNGLFIGNHHYPMTNAFEKLEKTLNSI